jgi:hypothetical protein
VAIPVTLHMLDLLCLLFFHLIRPVVLGIPNADLPCHCEILIVNYRAVHNSCTLLCLSLALDIGQFSFTIYYFYQLS